MEVLHPQLRSTGVKSTGKQMIDILVQNAAQRQVIANDFINVLGKVASAVAPVSSQAGSSNLSDLHERVRKNEEQLQSLSSSVNGLSSKIDSNFEKMFSLFANKY